MGGKVTNMWDRVISRYRRHAFCQKKEGVGGIEMPKEILPVMEKPIERFVSGGPPL